MRIAPGTEIAGIRISEIKQALARGIGRGLNSAEIGHRLRLLEPRLSQVLKALAEAGLIEHAGQHAGVDQWEITPSGQRMLASRIARPISRDRGRELLKQVIDAARQVNASTGTAYCVTEVAVFGSYLSNSPDLGDLDVAVQLAQRPAPDGRDLYAEACARAPSGIDYLGRITWPRQEVMRHLQVHATQVSLHDAEELEELGARNQVVYAFDLDSRQEQAVAGGIRTPQATNPDAGIADTPAGATPPSRACTHPQAPPYDPARATARPSRIRDARDRSGAPASRAEIAVQNAWANGLTAAEIIDAQQLDRQSVRSLCDLIVALYRMAEEPDRSPVSDCQPDGEGGYTDPSMDLTRDARGRPERSMHIVRKAREPADIPQRSVPRRIDHLDTALARGLGQPPCPVRIHVTARSLPGAPASWELQVSVREDDARNILASCGHRGDPRFIDAAGDAWAQLARQLYKQAAAWLARLTAATGAGVALDYWTDSERIAAAAGRPGAPARALDCGPLKRVFAERLEACPKASAKVDADNRLVALMAPTEIGLPTAVLRLLPRDPGPGRLRMAGDGVANTGVTRPLEDAFWRWWRAAPDVLRDLEHVEIRLSADTLPAVNPVGTAADGQ